MRWPSTEQLQRVKLSLDVLLLLVLIPVLLYVLAFDRAAATKLALSAR